jgi:DNA-binding response OmpR family regulator
MKNIILVEDDTTMGSLLKTLLEIEGYSAIILQGLDEINTLNAIIEKQPDAILMDVHLKSANGIKILNLVRGNPKTTLIPILMTSVSDLRNECLQSGANYFLMKPFMPDDLIHWLSKTLG